MGRRGDWKRVSKRRRCPVCDKHDWCMYAGPDDAPTAAICARIESSKRCGEAGWLHKLRDDWQRPATPRKPDRPEPVHDFRAFACACREALDPVQLARFADSLGLSIRMLKRLGIGWSHSHRAFTFPMQNPVGIVTAIRLRARNGRQWAVKGSRGGLFVPDETTKTGELYLPEGPTDTAAMLDLGCQAIGRASCNAGIGEVVRRVGAADYASITVVADRDKPDERGNRPGEKWAKVLAGRLGIHCRLWFLMPPEGVKDMRDWLRAGATRQNIESACVEIKV